MKKVHITFVAILLVVASVTTILSVRSHNSMDDFFRANVEALTGTEAYPGKVCYNEVLFGGNQTNWAYQEFCDSKTTETTKYTCAGERWGFVGTKDFCVK